MILASGDTYITHRASLVLSLLKVGLHESYISQVSMEKIYIHGATAPNGPGPPNYRGLKITLKITTLGRTLLDK
jgi:hypothetical protein